ncbi:MAG TPA: thiol-disulfide oxidoreductase DCC [Blastocatellia bacterium]|jgi:predicted DCC family thiol-disulfide oxidoreductase YuxK|nr:thiol-disulfide oxidoreductase DCC [Blastocatellia bacterium]HAF23431.1 thiol-disulfide oxidoreductase DCC [Blastocatellia bacterium]HCX30831.1 thiol-disulfide oxidoreductase DCC [Blastocatellia bacterium]
MPIPESNPIVLYDGVCGLCNRLNQFLLKRDTHDRFRFASLQSNFAADVLKRHGANPEDLDTVYVVIDYGQSTERLLTRSDAILHALTQLDGVWKLAATGRVLPKTLRDVVYKIVARNRYRVFGKYESCMLPEPKHHRKFLDV